jgi:hypothetical protein
LHGQHGYGVHNDVYMYASYMHTYIQIYIHTYRGYQCLANMDMVFTKMWDACREAERRDEYDKMSRELLDNIKRAKSAEPQVREREREYVCVCVLHVREEMAQGV